MSQRRARTVAVTMVLMLAAGAGDAAAHDRHSRPDLTVRTLTEPPAFAAPGSTFTAEDVTVNEGRRRAARSWTGYRLAHSVRVGGRPVPALRRWERSRGSAILTVPSAIADGAYRLVACADALHAVRERDEHDNCRSSAGVVVVDTAPPPAPLIVAGPPR
jgi:CARDB